MPTPPRRCAATFFAPVSIPSGSTEAEESVLHTLKRLEESLYRPLTRFDPEYMEELLASDFVEMGSSGRIWARHQIIRTQPVPIAAKLPLPEFGVHLVTDEVALVTYRTEMGVDFKEAANRSSIWRRGRDGTWKLVFHQGTPTTRR